MLLKTAFLLWTSRAWVLWKSLQATREIIIWIPLWHANVQESDWNCIYRPWRLWKGKELLQGSLSLLEELKLAGNLDEASFQRNLVNALMFQRKFEDAIEPSERAYYIRMKLLGNHPQTVHSIFQQGVLQANLGHLNKALQLFLDGWEMEKTLSVGNHGEVWWKIITGMEDMCDWTEKTGLKKLFRKEAFKFCQSFWE